MTTFDMIVYLNIVLDCIEDTYCKDLLEEVKTELEKREEAEENKLFNSMRKMKELETNRK